MREFGIDSNGLWKITINNCRNRQQSSIIKCKNNQLFMVRIPLTFEPTNWFMPVRKQRKSPSNSYTERKIFYRKRHIHHKQNKFTVIYSSNKHTHTHMKHWNTARNRGERERQRQKESNACACGYEKCQEAHCSNKVAKSLFLIMFLKYYFVLSWNWTYKEFFFLFVSPLTSCENSTIKTREKKLCTLSSTCWKSEPKKRSNEKK